MPGDIDVVAAFGDSISAGNGLGADTPLQVAIENRGESWDIGGDDSLEEGVITLPNIMRKFNPDVKGYSICASQLTYTSDAWFNVAEPGGKCNDMPPQAELLVKRMRDDKRINMTDDWKMITMFVGGNDLCASCHSDSNYTYERYYAEFEEALVILSSNLTRTVVNLVSMFDILPVQNFSTGLLCDLLQWGFCDCARNFTVQPTLRDLQIAYFDAHAKLANDTRFKRDDFTVLHQTHLRDMVPPMDENGDFYQDFLSKDCFHPSRIAHQSFAVFLWNTMLIEVGKKPFSYPWNNFEFELSCPTTEKPYIFTDQNSD